jgi:hypothetical protein
MRSLPDIRFIFGPLTSALWSPPPERYETLDVTVHAMGRVSLASPRKRKEKKKDGGSRTLEKALFFH